MRHDISTDVNSSQSKYHNIIERPASVVRELVKDSIKSGAILINISVKNGGITYINIADNGYGIPVTDVIKVFSHNLSREIDSSMNANRSNTIDDPRYALSYISTISEIKVYTKVLEEEDGTYAHFNYGELVHQSKVKCPSGTNITALNLFYTEPEKYKHFEKDSIELSLIIDVVKRICIQHLNVSIKLISDGSMVFHSPGNDSLWDCIWSLYGKRSNQLLEINHKRNGFNITGFISRPNVYYSSSNNIFVFIDGTSKENHPACFAVEDVYNDILLPGIYPLVILKISINHKTHKLDCEKDENSNEKIYSEEIYNVVYSCLTEKLKSLVDKRTNKNKSLENVDTHSINNQYDTDVKKHSIKSRMETILNNQKATGFLKEFILKNHMPDFSQPIYHIGQFKSRFFLMEQKDKLFIMDSLSTLERIFYHDLKRHYNTSNIQRVSHNLTLKMDRDEIKFITEHINIFTNMGFHLEVLDAEICIHKVPLILKNLNIETIMHQLVKQSSKINMNSEDSFEEQLIFCIGHLAAKDKYTSINQSDIIGLLNRVMKTENYAPTIIERLPIICIPSDALENIFLYQLML